MITFLNNNTEVAGINLQTCKRGFIFCLRICTSLVNELVTTLSFLSV